MRQLTGLLFVMACGGTPGPTPQPVHVTPVAPVAPDAEPSNPYRAATWVAKLDDPREAERALTELEQLGDPSAIPAIGKHWLETDRPTRMLQVIIALARPLTAADAKAQFLVDFEVHGRSESWRAALPFLTAALTGVDDQPRAVDNAVKAADALGEAGFGLDVLVDFVGGHATDETIVAHIAAIRAIGAIGTEPGVRALIKLIDRDNPPHARTAAKDALDHSIRTAYTRYVVVTGAAVNALARVASPLAARSLVILMYRAPELFNQIRRALVATGPAAKTELIAALKDTSAEIKALFATRKLDRYCGERGDAKTCRPLANREFYAAVVLGDFYDPTTVPDLLAVLDHPPLPVYVIDDQPSPNSQHAAAFDALRKIGSPAAAPRLLALLAKGSLDTRRLAAQTYPFVAHDAAGARALAAIASDTHADPTFRQDAAIALSRIADDDAGATRVLQYAHTLGKAGLEHAIAAQVAEIELAQRCKADIACYTASLAEKPDAAIAHAARYLPDAASWSGADRDAIASAAIDRALLELGRAKATDATDTVLALAASPNRGVHTGALLALARLAPRPCPRCVVGLDAAIQAAEGKPALGDLKVESQVLRNYFTWAGN